MESGSQGAGCNCDLDEPIVIERMAFGPVAESGRTIIQAPLDVEAGEVYEIVVQRLPRIS